MKNRSRPCPAPRPRSRIQDLDPVDIRRIEELADQKYGSRAIASRLKISRKIVRRVVEGRASGLPRPARSRPRKFDPYLEQIAERVKQGLTATRIFRELTELGYDGGRTVLARHVSHLRAQIVLHSRRAIKRRFETPPGAEMQVDWSPGTVEIGGKPTRIHVLGVILGHSRRLFIGIYRDEREPTLLEGLAQAFEYFDGCAMRCVFDNMSTVVLGRSGPDRKPLWHPRFLEFARHYGFEPFLCAVADPDRKGKIEKSFRLVFDDFLKGSTFSSWDDLARRTRVWLDQTPGTGNLRKHGTTGLVPNDAYLAEKELLVRLPEHRFPVYEEVVRAVDQDSTLSVKGIRYSVPSWLASRQAVVRLFADHFEVFDSRGEMAFSRRYVDRTTFPGTLVIDPSHYIGLTKRPDHRLGSKQLAEAFISRFPELAPFVDGLKRAMKGIATIHLHHLLRLAEAYGLDAFVAAATQAQDHHRFDAHAVRRILERDHPLPPESLQPEMCGLGPALLGEVEEVDLDEFAPLDQLPPTKEEPDADW